MAQDDEARMGALLTLELLRQWPLPMPGREGDKEARGRILIVGGSAVMPGPVILAANAALRAGAGKLTVAAPRSIAQGVALSIPESRVTGLDELPSGGVAVDAVQAIDSKAGFDAVLIGPGMTDETATREFARRLAQSLPGTALVLDAYAMSAATLPDDDVVRGRSLLTPHAGEMAHLSGQDKGAVLADPLTAARQAALEWGCAVALKGAATYVVSPDGRAWKHQGGNAGLAVSGSGDVLAGLIAGLLARGASIAQAAVWGVSLHAQAGDRLANRHGLLGYLARELAAEVPALMQALAPQEGRADA